jgi:hypothetical protein
MDPWTWLWELLTWAIKENAKLCKQTLIKQNVHQGIPQEELDKS